MAGTFDDPTAKWNRHGLHPGSIWTTFRTGMGWGLPALPDLTLAEAPGKRRLRFVAISDTHNKHADLVVPPGDVLIHAGDVTWGGTLAEVEAFNAWLGTLPHKHKIVVAGNHDFAFDPAVCKDDRVCKSDACSITCVNCNRNSNCNRPNSKSTIA